MSVDSKNRLQVLLILFCIFLFFCSCISNVFFLRGGYITMLLTLFLSIYCYALTKNVIFPILCLKVL